MTTSGPRDPAPVVVGAIPGPRVLLGRQSARPGDGVAAAFAAGRWFGELLGVCDALELSHTDVLETSWRRILGVGEADPRALACRAWPAAAGDMALVAHRCRAAALFVAELCRRRTFLADRVPPRRAPDASVA